MQTIGSDTKEMINKCLNCEKKKCNNCIEGTPKIIKKNGCIAHVIHGKYMTMRECSEDLGMLYSTFARNHSRLRHLSIEQLYDYLKEKKNERNKR